MNILQILQQLRDDIKIWVTNNINALNAKIDEKTIPIDTELDATSTNVVQNKAIALEIDDINKRVGDTSVANQISSAIEDLSSFSGEYNDLINAPSIKEDENDELIIMDEIGNIVFKTDEEGIHTTNIYIQDKEVATKDYVVEAVADLDVSDVFATIEYVDEAIEKIPQLELTDYYTKKETDKTIQDFKESIGEEISSEADSWKIVDDEGNIILDINKDGVRTTKLILNEEIAATETYVDNAVNSIEIPEVDFTGYATETYVSDTIENYVDTESEVWTFTLVNGDVISKKVVLG